MAFYYRFISLVDKGRATSIICLDLCKAFHTVLHDSLGDEKFNMPWQLCAHSRESQLHPGLQQNSNQPRKKGDSSLYSILVRSHLEHCIQHGAWTCWRKSPGLMEHFSEEWLGEIVVQCGEEKAPRRTYSSIPAPKGAAEKLERDCCVVTEKGVVALN